MIAQHVRLIPEIDKKNHERVKKAMNIGKYQRKLGLKKENKDANQKQETPHTRS